MTYTTIQGDCWDMIAFKVYGKESYMSKLLEANKQYRETYIFPAGVVIIVPEIKEETVSTAPPWRR